MASFKRESGGAPPIEMAEVPFKLQSTHLSLSCGENEARRLEDIVEYLSASSRTVQRARRHRRRATNPDGRIDGHGRAFRCPRRCRRTLEGTARLRSASDAADVGKAIRPRDEAGICRRYARANSHETFAARVQNAFRPWIFPCALHLNQGCCGARQGQYDPGAYKIRTGAVPDRSRGFGHMVPTYTRRDHAGS